MIFSRKNVNELFSNIGTNYDCNKEACPNNTPVEMEHLALKEQVVSIYIVVCELCGGEEVSWADSTSFAVSVRVQLKEKDHSPEEHEFVYSGDPVPILNESVQNVNPHQLI